MPTRITNDPMEAAEIVRAGGIVAFPTETVFGLGADATKPAAIDKLFAAKGRPTDNPLIVHLADRQQLAEVAREITPAAAELLRAFSPGPITVVVPKQDVIVPAVTAGLDSVAVRIPDHPLAQAFLQSAAIPIAAPSANRSGRPSATTVASVLEDLDSRIDAVLFGGVSRIGLESTVVDCTVSPPRLLRPGAITLEQLLQVRSDIELPGRLIGMSSNSPGLRYAHYQPLAKVRIVESADLVLLDAKCAFLGLSEIPGHARLGLYRRFCNVGQYAQELYESMRTADRLGIELIFCETVANEGIGRALSDRLTRAAH